MIDIDSIPDLRQALAAGNASPESVAKDALVRANSNTSHNVYISLDAERTLKDASVLPSRFAANPKPSLYGLPISLKDCFDLEGFSTSCGSKFYTAKNGIARADSSVAARLHSQGAVIVGKAHLHQLAYGITGENPEYADAAHPRDRSRWTGGSSRGGAAGVQEGSAVAAIGTDTGGSIRVPSALCGFGGFCASVRLRPTGGVWGGGVV